MFSRRVWIALVLTVLISSVATAQNSSTTSPIQNGELVITNLLVNQTTQGYYLGFVVSLDKLAEPMLIKPAGRFVRVSLPPGTYTLQGIGLWDLQNKRFGNYAQGTSGATLVIRAGKVTFLPFLLQSKLLRVANSRTSIKPDIKPVRLSANALGALRAEYTADLARGSTDVLPLATPESLAQSIGQKRFSGGPLLGQYEKPFAQWAKENGIAFPGKYTDGSGDALFPRLIIDPAYRSVEVRGYLPQKGMLVINWNGESNSQIYNGGYTKQSLTSTIGGTSPVAKIAFDWFEPSGKRMSQLYFVRFDGTNSVKPGRVERTLADGTKVVIEDSLVQVITPDVAKVFSTGKIGGQPIDGALLSIFHDSFDFLYVAPANEINLPGEDGDSQKVTNDTKGVGLSLFSNPITKRLRAVIRLITPASFTEGWSLMCHELLHSWANFIIPNNTGGHWGYATAAGKLGGIEASTLQSLGNGTYRTRYFSEVHDWWLPYSKLELYLMGLLPASEVPPVTIFHGMKVIKRATSTSDEEFSAKSVTTLTIRDIIKKYGPRVPAYPNAPHAFRALAVILTPRVLSPAETLPVREALAVFSDPRPLTFGAGYNTSLNFAAATRGLGSIRFDGLIKELKSTAPPTIPPSETAELVFTNSLKNETDFNFYVGFSISFEGLPKPILIKPDGRFVQVRLKPGSYRLKGISLVRLSTGKAYYSVPNIPEVDFELKAGQPVVFPWVFLSELLGTDRSYRPRFDPRFQDSAGRAALLAEYERAVKAKSRDLLPARGVEDFFLQPGK